MSAPAVHISQLCKSYGKAVALAGVSLDIAQGEFFGLVGANGAGKTTLVKCALDFCDIQSGNIGVFGIPHRETAARSRIAFLPERFTPPHYLNGRDFLRYLAELHRRTYDEKRAQNMLEALELDPAVLDKPARACSKGMIQKLGLAACLLADKELLILDEPTSGLDPKARALLKRELRRQHESGKTVLMTTHALHDVGEMCGRMAVVDHGRLLFAGTPGEFMGRHGASDLEQAYLACVAGQ